MGNNNGNDQLTIDQSKNNTNYEKTTRWKSVLN